MAGSDNERNFSEQDFGMTDQLYCLSNPDEPGLVRVIMRSDRDQGQGRWRDTTLCKPGEQVDWSLKVRDAHAALAALHKSMRRYRKNRGSGVYRCSPMDVREIAIRYTATRTNALHKPAQQVSDNILASLLVVAFLLSIYFTQSISLGTAPTLGITATVLATLTIAVAMVRGKPTR